MKFIEAFVKCLAGLIILGFVVLFFWNARIGPNEVGNLFVFYFVISLLVAGVITLGIGLLVNGYRQGNK